MRDGDRVAASQVGTRVVAGPAPRGVLPERESLVGFSWIVNPVRTRADALITHLCNQSPSHCRPSEGDVP